MMMMVVRWFNYVEGYGGEKCGVILVCGDEGMKVLCMILVFLKKITREIEVWEAIFYFFSCVN